MNENFANPAKTYILVEPSLNETFQPSFLSQKRSSNMFCKKTFIKENF